MELKQVYPDPRLAAAVAAMPKSGGTFTGAVAFGAGVNLGNSASLADNIGLALGGGAAFVYGNGSYGILRGAGAGVLFQRGGDAATLGSFDNSGNFVAVANVSGFSDARLKTNVQTITGALNLIEQMRGVRYERISTGRTEIGVVAQEMQTVLPEVVIEPVEGAADAYLAVAYGNIVGVLIEAVKELSARVKELEAK